MAEKKTPLAKDERWPINRCAAATVARVKFPMYPRWEFSYQGYECIIDQAEMSGFAWRGFVLNVPENIDADKINVHGKIRFDFEYNGQRILGFHTGHLCDITPGSHAKFPGAKSRTPDYVVTEIHTLVREIGRTPSFSHPSRSL